MDDNTVLGSKAAENLLAVRWFKMSKLMMKDKKSLKSDIKELKTRRSVN